VEPVLVVRRDAPRVRDRGVSPIVGSALKEKSDREDLVRRCWYRRSTPLRKGDALIAPSVTVRLLAAFSGSLAAAPPAQPSEPLTARERVAGGRTNAEIADELFISLSTAKTHLASLMGKLGARNRDEFAMWAYETDRVKG
jgi:DNA-binding NarL/FixJ family response regulator